MTKVVNKIPKILQDSKKTASDLFAVMVQSEETKVSWSTAYRIATKKEAGNTSVDIFGKAAKALNKKLCDVIELAD